MGLGKTGTALVAAYLRGSLKRRVLIPCGKSALSVWRKEIKLWFPELFENLVIIEGTPAKRKKLWDKAREDQCIIVCTSKVLEMDQALIPRDWDLIIPDEGHKFLRNHKTIIFKLLEDFRTEDMYIITGSPASKGVRHMFGYLRLLHPSQFKSYWQFIEHFCIVEDGQFGKEIIGVQNMEEFKAILAKIMIRRVKASNMPKKHRRRFYVEMSKDEIRAYKEMDETLIYSREDGTYLLSANAAVNQLRCRQLFICPKLIDPALGYGSSIEAVCENISEQELKHSVIFTPFPAAFPFFKEYIAKTLKVPVYLLKGGMDSVTVQDTIDKWNASGGIILCSIQFATSFNLTKASVGYMIGFEWDQNHNYQAEDRLHRMGITEDVIINYVMHDNVLVKRQLEIMNDKVDETNQFIPVA